VRTSAFELESGASSSTRAGFLKYMTRGILRRVYVSTADISIYRQGICYSLRFEIKLGPGVLWKSFDGFWCKNRKKWGLSIGWCPGWGL
jgi:hypothetical protein